jgi:hypothetical protein
MASVVTAMIRPAFTACEMVAGVGLTSTVFFYLGSEQEKDKNRRRENELKKAPPAPRSRHAPRRPPYAFK